MNGKENSILLKKRINIKYVKFKNRCKFVQKHLRGVLASFKLMLFAII